MKLNKYILGVCMLATTLFCSCETEHITDIYQPENPGITFTHKKQSVNLPAQDYEGFDVEVVRSGNLDEALECPVKVYLLDNKGTPQALPAGFTAPGVALFAAGEFKTMIHVKVDSITPGKTYKICFELGEEGTSVDAITKKEVKVYCK